LFTMRSRIQPEKRQREYMRNYYEVHREAINAYKRARRIEILNGSPLRRQGHARVPPKDPRTCLRCGDEFAPNAPNQRFCPSCGPLAFHELARARTKLYRENNKEFLKRKSAEWRAKHKDDELFRVKKKLQSNAYNDKIRQIVLSYYSGGRTACVCCGESEIDFLTLDHINNDGGRERKALRGKNAGGVGILQAAIEERVSRWTPNSVLRLQRFERETW
jgi:hypothetical protein